MFALRFPSFQDAGDIPPVALIEVNCLSEGVLNPGGKIVLLRLLQFLGNNRGQHSDILLVKGEDIRLLRNRRVRLALDQRSRFKLAALYPGYGCPVSLGIHKVQVVSFPFALQGQMKQGAPAHRLIQSSTQDFRRRALAFYSFHQRRVAEKLAVGDVTGVAPFLVQSPYNVERDLKLSEVVNLGQDFAEKYIGNGGKLGLRGETAELFHSKLGFLPSNFSRVSNFAMRSRK